MKSFTKGLFLLSTNVNAVKLSAILLWLNCFDVLRNQASCFKNGLQPQWIRYMIQALMLTLQINHWCKFYRQWSIWFVLQRSLNLTHCLVLWTDCRWMMQNENFSLKLPACLGLHSWWHHYHAFPDRRSLDLIKILYKNYIVFSCNEIIPGKQINLSSKASTPGKPRVRRSFCTVKKCAQYSPMVLFTQNIEKIKDATHKNGDVDSTCKWGLTHQKATPSSHSSSVNVPNQTIVFRQLQKEGNISLPKS